MPHESEGVARPDWVPARFALPAVPSIFGALALGIATLAYVTHTRARDRYLSEKGNELSAIADLKVSEIVHWRAERLADARVTAADPLLVGAVRDWLDAGAPAERAGAFQARLTSLRDANRYERISLLDAQGGLRLTVPAAELGTLATDALARQTLATAEASFLDLHRSDTGEGIQLQMVAPLRLAGDPAARAVALLVFQIDPNCYLYPLVQSWPTPSRTGETLLVRREGSEVLYLNELRHRKGTALTLRLPLAQSDLPSAMAVQGREGVVQGVDHRNQPVLAALRKVRDSPWFLVSKVDMEELVAPVARDAWLTALFAASMIALAALGARRSWRRERDASDAQLRGRDERLRLEGAALEAAANAVAITDRGGRIVWVNEAFVRLTGWSLEACRGKTPRILKSGHHDHAFYEEVWRTILGGAVWQHEMVNRRKDGSLYTEHQTITPVRDDRGEITHFVAIKIDVTDRRKTEEALRDSEERYRALTETSQDDIFIVDAAGRVVYLNARAALRFGGRDLAELRGRRLDELFPPDLAAAMEANVRKTTRTRQPVYDEREVPFPSGSVWLGVWFAPLEGDAFAGAVMGVGRDITERKLAEEAVAREQRLLNELITTIPDNIYFKDRDGRFLKINNAMAQWFGLSDPKDAVGKTDGDFFTQQHARQADSDEQRVMETGEPQLGIEEEETWPDGSVTWVSTSKVPIRDASGRIVGLVGVSRDITERKRAEESLRESTRVLIESQRVARLGSYRTDLVAGTWTSSAILDEIFGIADPAFRRDVAGWLSIVHPEEREEIAAYFAEEVVAKWQPFDREYRIVRLSDGMERWVHGLGKLVADREGRLIAMVGTIQDVTDRKRLEAQLRQAQKMDAIGQLAGGVAHDFNNLLSVIGGYSEMVLEGLPADHPQRKRVLEIRKAGERAAGLTRQLLTFGRKQAVAPVVLDLGHVVSGMEGMLRRLIPEHIEVVTRSESGAAKVKADAGHLEQVILNLAVNARDAMSDGGRLIIETSMGELDEAYCRRHAPARPGRYVLLAVSDSGTGMDAETQARIFEPFFTTKEVGKGAGLGLAIVYGIVKQNEGYIWVYSEPGRGTTFKVYLPRVDDAVAPAEKRAPRLETKTGNETVLLVEDDEAVRELNREILEDLGYRVLEGRDPESALQRAARHEGVIHLLLTDMVMPGMTGRQLAERLCSSRPGIRVLFVSGYTNDVVVHSGDMDAGKAFLQKPFTPDGLARKIREVLGAPP